MFSIQPACIPVRPGQPIGCTDTSIANTKEYEPGVPENTGLVRFEQLIV